MAILRSTSKLLLAGTSLTFLLFLYFISSSPSPYTPSAFSSKTSTCTPKAYSSGQWKHAPRTNRTSLTERADALDFAGFSGCASSREFWWHLAVDNQDHWSRFPDASSWSWVPGRGCQIRDWDPAALVQDLVEQGGWLLIGDSVTENHFFSLSCLLHPHVLGFPNYTGLTSFDRAWPQHLYLNPDSPLVSRLALPLHFDISSTPLVTFRRVDLLLSAAELVDLHAELYPNVLRANPDFRLFSDEAVWTLPVQEYVDLLTAPRPAGGYSTLIVSTAGHWTTTLFAGFHEDNPRKGNGMDKLTVFFARAMQRWADEVQLLVSADQRRSTNVRGPGRGARGKQVLIRAYLPGHDGCHDHRAPFTDVKSNKGASFNWGWIPGLNQVFEKTVSKSAYPNIHFLPIDRPARLRPDTHTTSDCLHIMTGAGVIEGWTHYIWHYVTKELSTAPA